MDVPLVVAGLLPTLGVVVVVLLAFRRRRSHKVPVFVNRYTLVVEDGAHAAEQTSQVQVVTTGEPKESVTRAHPLA